MSPFVQDLIALGIGLLAFVYLARRWWPSARALFKPNAPQAGCAPSTDAASCGSGCGQCGSASPRAAKDHRVHVVKRLDGETRLRD
ncbi:MAG: hypothetical protein ACM3VZ_13650 [Acidobacteriota bacterium]